MTDFEFVPDDVFEFDEAAFEADIGPTPELPVETGFTESVVVSEFWFTELYSTTVPEPSELAVDLPLPDPFQAAVSGAGMLGTWFARRRAERGGTLTVELAGAATSGAAVLEAALAQHPDVRAAKRSGADPITIAAELARDTHAVIHELVELVRTRGPEGTVLVLPDGSRVRVADLPTSPTKGA